MSKPSTLYLLIPKIMSINPNLKISILEIRKT